MCENSEYQRLKKDTTSFYIILYTKINSRRRRFIQREPRIKMSEVKATLKTRRYYFLTLENNIYTKSQSNLRVQNFKSFKTSPFLRMLHQRNVRWQSSQNEDKGSIKQIQLRSWEKGIIRMLVMGVINMAALWLS